MWADYRLFSYLLLGPRFNQKAEALLGEIKGRPYYDDVEKVILMVKNGNYEKLATEYTSCFINDFPKLLCPPYESWYREKTIYGESVREVLELYNAFGLQARKELPDHVATEFEFVAFLYKAKQEDLANKFVVEHVLTWVPLLAQDVIKYAKGDYTRALGYALAKFMEAEKARLKLS